MKYCFTFILQLKLLFSFGQHLIIDTSFNNREIQLQCDTYFGAKVSTDDFKNIYIANGNCLYFLDSIGNERRDINIVNPFTVDSNFYIASINRSDFNNHYLVQESFLTQGSYTHLNIQKLNSKGEFDSSFGTGSKVLISNTIYNSQFLTNDLGDLMISLYYRDILNDVSQIRIYKINPKGIIDSIFVEHPVFCTNTNANSSSIVNDIKINSNGNIIIEMVDVCDKDGKITYVGITNDLKIDSSFGNKGKLSHSIATNFSGQLPFFSPNLDLGDNKYLFFIDYLNNGINIKKLEKFSVLDNNFGQQGSFNYTYSGCCMNAIMDNDNDEILFLKEIDFRKKITISAIDFKGVDKEKITNKLNLTFDFENGSAIYQLFKNSYLLFQWNNFKGTMNIFKLQRVIVTNNNEEGRFGNVKLIENPISNILKIDIGKSFHGSYKIYDCFGKLLLNDVIRFDNKANLDVTNLSSGSYYLQLLGKNEILIGQFIKI